MKKIIKWALSAFVGIVVSFVLLSISESWHTLITCGMVAYVVAAIVYYGILEKSDMKLIVSVVSFIIVFILYFLVYNYVNNWGTSYLMAFAVFFVPYIIASYVVFAIASDGDSSKNDENNKSN